MRGSGDQKQFGMTLVELLVSMAVGVMLITGIIQLMASNKQHYWFQSELARIQESGRYALSVIREDLQMAGVSGCAANAGINNLLDTTAAGYSDTLFNLGQAVGGWEYIAAGSTTAPGDTNTISMVESSALSEWDNGAATNSDLDGTLNDKIYRASDVLVVKSTEPALDLTNTAAFTFPITTTSFSTSGYLDSDDGSEDEGRIVVISDCIGADLFQNCSSTPNLIQRNVCSVSPANSLTNFGHQYEVLMGGEDATISAVSVNTYYVGAGSNDTPTLYRKDYSRGTPSSAEPLVEGVESMQVLYGVDTDGDLVPNQYVTATGLGAVIGAGTYADNIVSVRISLLLRSIDEVEEINSSDSLLMAETTINSGSDRYLRKTVSTTVQLRNRGI